MNDAPSPTSRLFYWSDELGCYVSVPRIADTPALRELLDFDGLDDGGEVVVRFRRVDLSDEELRT